MTRLATDFRRPQQAELRGLDLASAVIRQNGEALVSLCDELHQLSGEQSQESPDCIALTVQRAKMIVSLGARIDDQLNARMRQFPMLETVRQLHEAAISVRLDKVLTELSTEIPTIGALLDAGPERVLKIRGCGEISLSELRNYLKSIGFDFGAE